MDGYIKWRTPRGRIHVTREGLTALCGVEIDPQFDRRTNIKLGGCRRCFAIVEDKTGGIRRDRYRNDWP